MRKNIYHYKKLWVLVAATLLMPSIAAADGENCGHGTAVRGPVLDVADFNGDGTVTNADVKKLIKRIMKPRGKRYAAFYDLNQDGKLNHKDVKLTIRQLGQSSSSENQDIAKAFNGTAKYMNINKAIDDGFTTMTQEVIGHGIHFANLSRVDSNHILDKPEGLNYDWENRLIAIFYYLPALLDLKDPETQVVIGKGRPECSNGCTDEQAQAIGDVVANQVINGFMGAGAGEAAGPGQFVVTPQYLTGVNYVPSDLSFTRPHHQVQRDAWHRHEGACFINSRLPIEGKTRKERKKLMKEYKPYFDQGMSQQACITDEYTPADTRFERNILTRIWNPSFYMLHVWAFAENNTQCGAFAGQNPDTITTPVNKQKEPVQTEEFHIGSSCGHFHQLGGAPGGAGVYKSMGCDFILLGTPLPVIGDHGGGHGS